MPSMMAPKLRNHRSASLTAMLQVLCLASLLSVVTGYTLGDFGSSAFYISGENDTPSAPVRPLFTNDGWKFSVQYFRSDPAPAVQKMYIKLVSYDTATATNYKPTCGSDLSPGLDVGCDFPLGDYYVIMDFDTGTTSYPIGSSSVTIGAPLDSLDADATVEITIPETALAEANIQFGADGSYETGVIIGYYEEADPALQTSDLDSNGETNSAPALIDYAFHQELFKIHYDDRAIFTFCDKDQQASFMRFAYARVHEVPVDGAPSQFYASVSFAVDELNPTLESYNTISESYGDLVDLGTLTASVNGNVVVDGASASTCSSVASQVSPALAQDCAPDPDLCSGTWVEDSGYATFYFPLGPTAPEGGNVDLNFVIQLQEDITGGANNIIFEAVAITITTTNGVIEWCSAPEETKIDLDDNFVVNAYSGVTPELHPIGFPDILVPGGSVISGEEPRLDGAEQSIDPTGNPETDTLQALNSDAKTATDALITVTVGFEDDLDTNAFQVASDVGFVPVLEDLITLHMIGDVSGDNSADPSAAVADPCDRVQRGAMKVQIDATGAAKLDYSVLEQETVCSTTKNPFVFPTSAAPESEFVCYIRNDFANGDYMQIDVDSLGDGGQFLEDLANGATGRDTPNDYAKDLGDIMAKNIQDDLISSSTSRNPSPKAFWINPGEYWGDATTAKEFFSLSTSVCVVALFRFDLAAGTGNIGDGNTGPNVDNTVVPGERRMVASSGSRRSESVGSTDSQQGISTMSFKYDVTPSTLAAAIAGVDQEYVTSWDIDMELSAADACLEMEVLVKKARSNLLAVLPSASKGFKDVQVSSVTLQNKPTSCRRSANQRLLLAGQTPSMTVKALIVFDDQVGSPSLDRKKLEDSTGILSVTQTETSNVVTVVVSEKEQVKTPVEADEGSSLPIAAIAGGAGGAVAVLALAGVVWWRRSQPASTMEVAHVPSPALDSKMSGLRGELEVGPTQGV